MDKKALGRAIRDARQTKGLMQKEVANKLGLLQSTYSNYENGYSIPSIVVLQQLSELLDTDFLEVRERLLNENSTINSRDAFLVDFKNETEQLMFFEELTQLRRDIDSIKDKRTRRKIADIFSQIFEVYSDAFHSVFTDNKSSSADKERNLESSQLRELSDLDKELFKAVSKLPPKVKSITIKSLSDIVSDTEVD